MLEFGTKTLAWMLAIYFIFYLAVHPFWTPPSWLFLAFCAVVYVLSAVFVRRRAYPIDE